MSAPKPEYVVERGPSSRAWILRGVIRLESAEAYARAFGPLEAAAAQPGDITIDISSVVFLNSSGIRALADVLLAARRNGGRVTLFGSAAVPWQKKLALSFTGLFPEFEIRLDR
ncbi:MAG TPA: STAS domain-containing protein [Anaeromyxobacter sp.]